MNVYEIAQKVNERLNGGDESKFPTTLLVVTEVLYALKPLNCFGSVTRVITYGGNNIDEYIMNHIDIFNEIVTDNNYLETTIALQNYFNTVNHNIRKIKLKVVKLLGVSALLTGVAIGCYIIYR